MSLVMSPFTFRNKTLQLASLSLLAAFALSPVHAKLPVAPATPESSAKAEEAKVKAAEASKLANDQLAASQDKVAAHWGAKVRAQGKEFKPTAVVTAAAVSVPASAPTAAVAAPKK
jgi:hypothetical protein